MMTITAKYNRHKWFTLRPMHQWLTFISLHLAPTGTDIATVEPTLTDVAFLADINFIAVAEGNYDVVITPTGTKDAAIGPLSVSLSAGGIYTALAVDASGGGVPLGVILLDDFVATR